MEKHELNEILKALRLFSEENDKRFTNIENHMNEMKSGVESRFGGLEARMDERFDRLEAKVDGIRVDLTETQETVDFLAQHEKKLRKINY